LSSVKKNLNQSHMWKLVNVTALLECIICPLNTTYVDNSNQLVKVLDISINR